MDIVKSSNVQLMGCYDWTEISTGKLLLLAQLCKANRKQNPLADDIYCLIRNAFYKNDKPKYEYIERHYEG